MKVKSEREVTQSCLTPSDPMGCSLPGSSIHGIFQARVLQWGAIAFSLFMHTQLLSRVQLFATPWAAAYQAPPSMGFSRQEYWSGLPLLKTAVSQPFDLEFSKDELDKVNSFSAQKGF